MNAAWLTVAVWAVARVCLVAMFVFSALEKVWHWNNALVQTRQSHLPGAPVMLAVATLVEGLTPLMIIFGVFDRLGAFLLAGFCVVTAFLYHPFWTFSDLWSPRDDSVGREHFWQFTKNFCIVGGLILVIFAGDLASTAQVLSHPFASSLHHG